MPKVTDEDMKLIGQPIDFLGLNIYVGSIMTSDGNGNAGPVPQTVGFPRTAIHWEVIPPALYWGPRYNYERYKLPIFITENGMYIGGYFQWSLMDNFEWSDGYNERFGIIYVDYPTGNRTPKDSAYWYKKIIESNGEEL